MERRSFFTALAAGIAGLFVGKAAGKVLIADIPTYGPAIKPASSAWQCARCGKGNPITRDFCSCGKPVAGLYYDCDMTEEWKAHIKTRPANWQDAWHERSSTRLMAINSHFNKTLEINRSYVARIRRLKAVRKIAGC